MAVYKQLGDSAKELAEKIHTAISSSPTSDGVARDLELKCNTPGGDCGGTPDIWLSSCKRQVQSGCEAIVREGVQKYCKKEYREAVCGTTATPLLPFIIGGVVGAIVLVAIAIGIFIYCRGKKKKAGKGQTMTGTTVTGTTTAGTGTNTAGGGPATATATATNVPARY